VSDFEERIRRELTAVAALARPETIRPLRVPAPSRRPRVSGWLAPIAAMAAVAAIAGVTVAVREIARGPASPAGQQTAPGPTSAAGRPDIYVTLTERYLLPIPASSSSPFSTGGTVLSATIRDASSGAALTSVQLSPRQPEHPRGPVVSGLVVPTQIAAAADDRTFVISGPGGLDILHVAASGRVAQVVHLSMTIPVIISSAIALSPDASKLAADIEECPVPNQACVEGIEIVTLTTGTAKVWLGSSMAGVPLDPAWTDNGKAVMFQWSSGRFPQNGYRILSDAAPQGNLTTESVPLPYPPAQRGFPPTAVLTPDGRSLLIVTKTIVPASPNSGTIIFRITDVAPRTGRLLRVLRVFEEPYQGNPYVANVQCSILSLAPAGLHALVECPQFGRLDGSTFTPLPGGPPDDPNAAAMNAAW
jgi:hypothetical protein